MLSFLASSIRRLTLLALTASALLWAAQAHAQFGRHTIQMPEAYYYTTKAHSGVIATRAMVLRDNNGKVVRRPANGTYLSQPGKPQWVVYLRNGFLDPNPTLPNGLGTRANTDVLSAGEYRAYAAQLVEVTSNPANAQRKTLTVEEYEAGPCGLNPTGARGQGGPRMLTGKFARFATFHVIVRDVPDAQAVCSDYVLLETPINTLLPEPQLPELAPPAAGSPTSGQGSLLFDTVTHAILFGTQGVIGRETAFYLAGGQQRPECEQTGDKVLDGEENNQKLINCRLPIGTVPRNDTEFNSTIHVLAPIPGVPVWLAYLDIYDAQTNQDGSYVLNYGYYDYPDNYGCYDYQVTAQLLFTSINPRVGGSNTFLMRGGDHHPVGLNNTTHWPVDTTIVGGALQMTNVLPNGVTAGVTGTTIPTSVGVAAETRYSYRAPAPDCTRQPGQPVPAGCFDVLKNLEHQGLLSAIDEFDLRDMDIYVYRVSDGEMLGRRWMLNQSELTPGKPEAVFVNHMRGLENPYVDNGERVNDANGQRVYKPWQPGNLQLEYTSEGGHRRNPLRTGDLVKIIAINRATGYIGTATQTVAGGIGGLASLELLNGIQLGPPNLKVTARRTWVPKEGASANQKRESIIGGEGAGMATDEAIVIDTEWYDRDGTLLPASLPGYTGRLARVCSAGAEGGAPVLAGAECAGSSEDDINLFDVRPGRQTEIIRLPEGSISGKGHYYVQIDGTNADAMRPFDPGTYKPGPFCYYVGTELVCNAKGAGDGALAQRPATYVPVLVPYYDKAASDALRKRYEDGELDDEPKPVYRWFYRPEMHFSLFDLELKKLEKTDSQGQRQDLTSLVTDNDNDTMPVLGSGDQGLDLVALLKADEFTSLTRVGTPRDLYLKVGSKELSLVAGADGNLRLNAEDLEALDSEDFLTVQLLQRYDEGNVLWEFAFARLAVIPGGAEYFEVSADDPVVPINALLLDGSDEASNPPPRVRWSQEGSGTLLGSAEQTSPEGKFNTQLQLAYTAGATSRVAAELLSSGGATATSWSATFKTVPGKPANLSCTTADGTKTVIGGLGQVEVRCTLTDQRSNAIPDFPVSIEAVGLEIVSTRKTNEAGFVSFALKGNQIAGDVPVVLSANDARSELSVRVHDVALVWNAPANVVAGQPMAVSLSATSPYGSLEGLNVGVAAHRGKIGNGSVVLNSAGQASLTVTAGEISGVGRLYAHVGETAVTQPFDVTAGPNVTLTHSMLIGDVSTSGTFPVTMFPEQGGNTLQIPYHTTTDLVVSGSPGEQATVTLESPEAPAREAALSYPMRTLPSNGLVIDAAQGIDGTAVGITLAPEGPQQTAQSYRFARATSQLEPTSEIRVPNDAALDLASDLGFSLWIKPSAVNQPLVDYVVRNLKLTVNSSSQLEAQAVVAGTAFTVRSGVISLLSWHRVAVVYRAGRLALYVDGTEFSTPVSGSLVKNTQTQNAVVLGRGYDGLMSEFEVTNWASGALVGFADGGGTERSVTLGADGKATLTIASTGVQTTGTQRVLRKWERRQRLLGVEGARVAFAAELPQQCRDNAVPEDPLDAARQFLSHLIHCELEVEAETLTVKIKRAGLSYEATVLVADLARVSFLTKIAMQAQVWLEAVECSRAVATGESNVAVGKVCAFASDLFFIGDLRDLAIHSFYFYTNNSKFDSATHFLAGLGLTFELLAILAAPTGAGAVASEAANAAAASAKFIVKAYNKTGAVVRGLTDTLKKLVDFNNPVESIRALNKLAPFIEIAAAVAIYKDEFGQAIDLLEETITDENTLLVVANFVAEYYEWFNSLTPQEQQEIARLVRRHLSTAWAAPVGLRVPARKMLDFLKRMDAHALEMVELSSWAGQEAVRRAAHFRLQAAIFALQTGLPAAKRYTRDTVRAFHKAAEVSGEAGAKALAGWRGMIGAANNRIMDLDKLYSAIARLDVRLSTPGLREGLARVIRDLDQAINPETWYAAAKAQGSAFHLYAMSRMRRSAGEFIEAIEETVEFSGYRRIYDYVIRNGAVRVYKEVKSWKPEYVLQNLRDELKVAKKGGSNAPGPNVDPVDARLREAKPDSDKKGGGQLFRDLVHLADPKSADAIVEYELRHGIETPTQDQIHDMIRDTLKDGAARAELKKVLGVADDRAFNLKLEELLERLKFTAIPNP